MNSHILSDILFDILSDSLSGILSGIRVQACLIASKPRHMPGKTRLTSGGAGIGAGGRGQDEGRKEGRQAGRHSANQAGRQEGRNCTFVQTLRPSPGSWRRTVWTYEIV